MEKEVTLGTIQYMYINLFADWEHIKNEIELDPKSLYNLIGLKKTVLSEMEKMQEAVRNFLDTVEGVIYHEDGSFQVPEIYIPEVNSKLADMNTTPITIQYNPIEIDNERNKVPIGIMEVLFDFIEIK